MSFIWNPDKIRFMRDASEYCSYYSDLVRLLQPYLADIDHICDAGCGLGYLSLELAKEVKKVTSVDVNSDALSVLRENCASKKAGNILPVCDDIFSMTIKELFPAMVFCYFGDIDDIVRSSHKLCCGPVYIIKRNYRTHKFSSSVQDRGSDTFEAACGRLDELGMIYKTSTLKTEFGQPFRNRKDAELFYRIYNPDNKDPGQINCFIDTLEKTGRDDYPLYYSNPKEIGCIILDPSR